MWQVLFTRVLCSQVFTIENLTGAVLEVVDTDLLHHSRINPRSLLRNESFYNYINCLQSLATSR